MSITRIHDGKKQQLIFRRYIVQNGEKIYPVTAKAFPIWVDVADEDL